MLKNALTKQRIRPSRFHTKIQWGEASTVELGFKRPCGYIFTHLGYRKFCPCFFGSCVNLWSKFDHTSYQTDFSDSKWWLYKDNSNSSQKKLKIEKFEIDKVIIIRLLCMSQEVIFFCNFQFWNLNIRLSLLKSAVFAYFCVFPKWRHLGVPDWVKIQS